MASLIPVCCFIPRQLSILHSSDTLGTCETLHEPAALDYPWSRAALPGGRLSPGGRPVPVTQVSTSQADYLHLETPNPFARLAQTPSPLLPTVLWPWARSKATP